MFHFRICSLRLNWYLTFNYIQFREIDSTVALKENAFFGTSSFSPFFPLTPLVLCTLFSLYFVHAVHPITTSSITYVNRTVIRHWSPMPWVFSSHQANPHLILSLRCSCWYYTVEKHMLVIHC